MFLYCERNAFSKTGAAAFPRYFLILWFILASEIKPKEEKQFMLIDDIYLILKCSFHWDEKTAFIALESMETNSNISLHTHSPDSNIFEVELKRFSLVRQIKQWTLIL